MTRSLLFAMLLVLCLPLAVRAGEVSVSPPPHLSAKLIGVTVLVGCPDERLRQVIRHKGEELGADYTVFPQVAAAAWCPVTESPGPLAPRPTVGPLWSFSLTFVKQIQQPQRRVTREANRAQPENP